jgi:hypothetical protein
MKMMKIFSSCSLLAYVVTARTEPARNETINMLRAAGTSNPQRSDLVDPVEVSTDFMDSSQPQDDQCLYINGEGWYDWYCTEAYWQGALCEWRCTESDCVSTKPSHVADTNNDWRCTSDGTACFYDINSEMNWWDAHTACQALDSSGEIYLARSLDQEDQDVLDSFDVVSWIAGFRENGWSSQWYWSHGAVVDAAAAAVAADVAGVMEFYTETDTLTILEYMLLENGIPDGDRRRKRQAGATDTNADTVNSISDQMALTGCWCPKLNELTFNGKGEARDEYDQKCRHMAACIRRVNECGACNGLDVTEDLFSVAYDAASNSFDCSVGSNTACETALCTCQMEWGISVVDQILSDGNVMKSDAANLDVSDTCVASNLEWTFVC